MIGIVAELVPEPADVDVDCPVEDVRLLVAVDGIEQLIAGQHAPVGLDEGRQQAELDAGEGDDRPRAQHLVSVAVDDEVGMEERRPGGPVEPGRCRSVQADRDAASRPPQDRLHAQDQLGGREWLRKVVVCTVLEAGDSAEHAREMYDHSVTNVALAAFVVAVVASVVAAIVLARMLAAPLAHVGRAARRVAEGDYAARVPRGGPEELVSLADSFNQMAASLERQEAMRRDFIISAAHELRTPLTNLQGYLEALRDGVIEADPATYDSLWEEAERLVRLSRSLDALAEGETGGPPKLVDLDLADAIRSTLELAQPSFDRAGLTLTVDLPERLPARANPDHLAQVLGNLVSNAVRYTASGGVVTVRADRRPGDLLVSIANTGEPIPPDDLGRVFERFYRVEKSRDRARGGAGIGLAIVKQLVEAGGGQVGAESADGLTRFWFTLPATAPGRG